MSTNAGLAAGTMDAIIDRATRDALRGAADALDQERPWLLRCLAEIDQDAVPDRLPLAAVFARITAGEVAR